MLTCCHDSILVSALAVLKLMLLQSQVIPLVLFDSLIVRLASNVLLIHMLQLFLHQVLSQVLPIPSASSALLGEDISDLSPLVQLALLEDAFRLFLIDCLQLGLRDAGR